MYFDLFELFYQCHIFIYTTFMNILKYLFIYEGHCFFLIYRLSFTGNNRYSFHSKMLFDDITKKCGKNDITWNNLLDFLIETLNPKIDQKVTFSIDKIEDVSHAKVGMNFFIYS